jgi:hypothetical protein
MGGIAAPPLIAATSQLPPIFVWRPRPRRARVKMVAKQAFGREGISIGLVIEKKLEERGTYTFETQDQD